MCCQLHLVSVTEAEVCIGLFVYLCYRIEESCVHHLVLNSVKAPAGRTDTTQASTSVVHRRDTMSGKKGLGVKRTRNPLEVLSCLVTPMNVVVVPVPNLWEASNWKSVWKLNMNCCPKLQELKREGCWGHSQEELCCGTWDEAGSFGYPLPGSTAPGASRVPTFSFFWRMLLGRALTPALHTPDFIHKCFCKEYITTLSLCSRVFS